MERRPGRHRRPHPLRSAPLRSGVGWMGEGRMARMRWRASVFGPSRMPVVHDSKRKLCGLHSLRPRRCCPDDTLLLGREGGTREGRFHWCWTSRSHACGHIVPCTLSGAVNCKTQPPIRPALQTPCWAGGLPAVVGLVAGVQRACARRPALRGLLVYSVRGVWVTWGEKRGGGGAGVAFALHGRGLASCPPFIILMHLASIPPPTPPPTHTSTHADKDHSFACECWCRGGAGR
jgi:hypothetical protein